MVVISGASSGMGRATAVELAGRGFHVLAGVRDEQAAVRLRRDGIEPVTLDVTQQTHVAALAERIDRDATGRPLRALVNCAGAAGNGPVEVLPLSTWRRLLEVNLLGQVAMIQALLPALRRSGGRVVNISSIGGRIAMPAFGAYSATKFAVEAMSDALRREVRDQGVDVVVVEPGAVRTGMIATGTAAAQALVDDMLPEDRTRYDDLMQTFLATAAGFDRDGVSAEHAGRVIAGTVTARRPRTRYTIGRDAAVFTRLARLVPDRALDRALTASGRRTLAAGVTASR